MHNSASNPIAIVGISFRFPGNLGTEKEFWDSLLQGLDLVTEVDNARWATDVLLHPKRSEPGRSVTFSAGVLDRVDQFDAGFFGISPREAAWLDPQQRLLLELAWEAMENGGLQPSRLAGSNCGVYVGISGLDYGIRGLDDLASMSAHTMTGNTLSIAANRLSYVFDLHGPSMAIDTACSSSLVALHQACNALRVGDAAMALVGGVNMLNHPYPFIGFSKASMLSSRGRCRTFDASGDGYVRAEGGAVVLLKPLADAQADGDRIHGVILASGANADGGRKTGLTIPSREGQIELMRSVLVRSGLAAEEIDFLEAHGTGTAIGDPIEMAAIGAVYGASRASDEPLPIGSVKTNLGHLEPASGMAGLLKALLVLKYRQIPPSIHLETPNPKIDFENWRLRPVTELLSLRQDGRPLVAAVNSFGFGGANAHVIIRSSPVCPVADGSEGIGAIPLLLSARNETALRELAGLYGELLAGSEAINYYDLAYSAAYRRERLEKRLIVQLDQPQAVAAALKDFAAGRSSADVVVQDAPVETGKLVFVYAGNGAQWIGMGQRLLEQSQRFRELMQDLDQRIAQYAHFSLIEELQGDASVSRMADTAVAQPLLFALQVALTVMLREEGIFPDAVAGHSVGEVAAAWAAGALTLDEAVRVICARSAAQALTRGAGRMAAISLAEKEMQDWLAQGTWPALEIAGINSPGNLTVTGPLPELASLEAFAKKRGVVCRLLDLDYAFHSCAMDPVESILAESLTGFTPASRREKIFVSAVTGGIVEAPLDAAYWWDNIRQPVRFQQAIESLAALGCRTFVEISPHAILQRYLKECLAGTSAKYVILPSLRKNYADEKNVRELALRLHLISQEDTLKKYFPSVGRYLDLPLYPWQRERHWLPQTSEGYRLIERHPLHPLLGWRLKDAQAGWENILDPRHQTWLTDHCVGGAVVLPGAAYAEMALAAARYHFSSDTLELEELDILAPVVFDGEHGRTIRFDLNPRDGNFQIRSRQRLSEDEWTLNASGRLLGSVSGYQEQPFPFPKTDAIEVDSATHYQLAHRLGLDYGALFQGMAWARMEDSVLEGRFAVPAGLDLKGWLLHPALLDVCFQSLLDLFRAEIEAGVGLPLLPVKIGRLRLLRPGSVTTFRTRVLRRSLRSVLAEFELLAESGEKVAVLHGCRFRAASLRQDKHAYPACWEIIPVVRPGQTANNMTVLPQSHTLTQRIKEWFVEEENQFRRMAYFGEAQPLLDALVTAFCYEAMQELLAESALSLEALEQNPACHERQSLLAWVKDTLIEQSYLAQGKKGWKLAENDMPAASEIWRTLLAEYPESMPELILIGRRGRALPKILAGKIDPSVLAAELKQSHQLDTLYDDSITYRGTRLALVRLLNILADQLPAQRRLRILEIAPGLSDIPRQLGHIVRTEAVDYVLAHGNPAACDHLRHEYQEDDWVNVADFETSPPLLKSKSCLPLSYDVVIFHHVLHDAADPRALLSWGQTCLTAGGMLVVAERHSDLAGELIWGKQSLVSPQAWQTELAALGMEEIEICREPAGEASPVGGYLVLSKRRETVGPALSPETSRWLLLAGDSNALAIAEQVMEIMVAHGQVAVGVACQDDLLEGDRAASLWAGQQKEFDDGVVDQVIFIAGDRGADDITLTVEALNLVRALAREANPPKLVLATSGGAPVDGLWSAEERNPAHSALWGFGRVVMNEYPGLCCRLVDMPRGTTVVRVAELLGEELLNPDGENEVILRPAGRYGLRMVKAEWPKERSGESTSKPYRLDFRVPGQLRNLFWLEQPETPLSPDDVEVRPVATGLNFRDIMYVMGLLPDEAVEHGFAGASLGLEFSGVVTRVGGRVDEFAPGDAVMGFGSACFASHVVTRANALTPKPESWSFEAAATVPTVFFTVYYALRQLANLQPGERVLIHGGAGGVGIAAIQLARHLGAEVFATAGSEEKRQFVDLLGAHRVFDSRNLAYADQILAATGGEGVDVVLNSLAGEAIRRNFRVLRPFGRFLELGKRDFFENTPIGLRPFKDNISYFGIDADQLLIARPELAARLFREVMALFRAGVLSPLPVRTFSAERVVDAFRYMQQARQIGKVVVTFEGAAIDPVLLAPEEIAPRFSRRAAYWVTGGLSGFGLETARWLAAQGAGQVVLLSRRGASTPGAEDAVASIKALGAEVVVLACDVADSKALQQVLQQPGLLPLKGVFHAAMVMDDALIVNLDAERMRRVLIPKIRGGWNLHELTREMALDYFVLYSSVTTYIGNPGQANYVAANTWLESLAGLRRSLGLPVTCIGWGPIGDAGYLTRNQAVKDALASRLGAEPLSSAMALRALGRVLTSGQANLSVSDFQFSSLARLLPSTQGPRFISLRRHASEMNAGTENLEDFRALIEGKTPGEVQAIVAQLITQEVAQILAVSAERIDPAKSLHDLGLDSLMGVELALGLEKRFGIQVPAMMLNEGPTVERVTARIIERLSTVEASPDENAGLTGTALTVAAQAVQHGEDVSQEMVQAVVAEIEMGQSKE